MATLDECIEEESENVKDEEGSQAKNKPVDNMNNESFYHEISETVPQTISSLFGKRCSVSISLFVLQTH